MVELHPTEIVTEPVRLAFPALFAPKPVMKGSTDLKYQAALLIPPSVDLAPFVNAVKAAMDDQWGKAIKLSGRGNPINSCDEKELNGYEDGWRFINVKSKYQPSVVDQKRMPILDPGIGDLEDAIREAENRIYAGCWCRFHISAYAWDNQFGKGVSFSLNAVQLVREDTRLDGKRSAKDVFDAIDTTDEDAVLESGAVEDGEDLFS
jgi:hypothetical protein